MKTMSQAVIPQGKSPPVTVLATLPPPVTGMTLVTEIVLAAMRAAGPVRTYNLSDGKQTGRRGAGFRACWRWRAVKALLTAWSSVRLLARPRQRDAVCYTVANSGAGLFGNLLTVGIARMSGCRCVLHHHSYSYLCRRDWRMKLLDRLLGPAGTHVFLGREMAEQFRELYDGSRDFVIMPSTVILLEQGDLGTETTSDRCFHHPFRLGHISNLTMEKGLDLVLETFGELRRRSLDVSLILAGPLMSKREQELVERAKFQYGQRLDYRGPVYGEQKQRFFRDIDVMLFPTRYKTETQPLVIAEAFAYGNPVIAYGRGCIPSLIGREGGHVVPVGEEFVLPAAEWIESWIDDPRAYRRLRGRVEAWARELQVDARESLARFVDGLFPQTGAASGDIEPKAQSRKPKAQSRKRKAESRPVPLSAFRFPLWVIDAMPLLEKGLHNRNGFVRKGCAALLRVPRVWARVRTSRQVCAQTPPVLANSFPKSGTHLLEQAVSALPHRRNFGTFLASMTSSFVFRERSEPSSLRMIEAMVPGEVVRGHLFYRPSFERALAESGVVHYFIYRDPRDVVVSESHYLRSMNRWHRLHPYFRQLRSREEAISLSILGLVGKGDSIDYPDVGQRFARYAGWMHNASICAVRFEELISSERTAVIARMVRFYAQHCSAEVDERAVVERALANIQPQKSHTYHKGRSGGWRHAFTARHKQQFKRVTGDLLVQLGYEQSLDW